MSDYSSAGIHPLWFFIIRQSPELEERLSGASSWNKARTRRELGAAPRQAQGGPGAPTLMFAGEDVCGEGLGSSLGRILHLV